MKLWTIIGILIGMLLLGTLIYTSFQSSQVQCELCVEYKGQRQCRLGAGINQEDAQKAAVRAACGVMANGMTESISCNNVRPTEVSCTGT